MSDIPSSLTVLRPIGFGTIKGPDGQDLSVIPNLANETDAVEPTTIPNVATASQTITTPTALPSPMSPMGRVAAIRAHEAKTAAAAAIAAARSASPATSPNNIISPSGHDDDVDHIELGVNDGSDDEDEVIGFSSAELAGRPTAGPNRDVHHDDNPGDEFVNRSDRGHSQSHELADPHPYDEETGHASRRESMQGTPLTTTRTILLDEANLPQTTVPPMSRMKMQTFDELKYTLRWKTRGMWALAASIFVMGVVCIAIGANSIKTAFLYPSYPYCTLIIGIFMLLYSPFAFYPTRHHHLRELRLSYLISGGFLAFTLVLGILIAKKAQSGVESDVRQNWNYDPTIDGSTVGKYSNDRQEDFRNDPDYLVSLGNNHLADMAIVELLSAFILLLYLILTVRVTHIVAKFLTLTKLQTASKSSSAAAALKRSNEIAAYKASLAQDPSKAFDIVEERIPDDVKFNIAIAKSRKYEMERAQSTGKEKDKKKKKKSKSEKDKDKKSEGGSHAGLDSHKKDRKSSRKPRVPPTSSRQASVIESKEPGAAESKKKRTEAPEIELEERKE